MSGLWHPDPRGRPAGASLPRVRVSPVGMNVEDAGDPSVESALEERPEFELECLYDDTEDPSSVTIFYPRGERTVSEWVTADTDTAVSLEALR